MPTPYAAYIATDAPQHALDYLRGWPDERLITTPVEEIIDDLFARWAIKPVTITGEEVELITPNAPRDGVRVRLRLSDPGLASAFLSVDPSTRHSHPALTLQGPWAIFEVAQVRSPEDVQGPVSRIKANFEQAARDIEQNAAVLRAHLTNVATSAKRDANGRQAESARALEALAAAGIPVSGLAARVPDDPATAPSPSTEATEEPRTPTSPSGAPAPQVPDDPPISPQTEQALRDAVALVRSTTSRDVQMRAIRQVQVIVADWRDYSDERALFADLLVVGLEKLAAFVDEGVSAERKQTVLDSLNLNLKHAIEWANANHRVQFARYLAEVVGFVIAMRSS